MIWVDNWPGIRGPQTIRHTHSLSLVNMYEGRCFLIGWQAVFTPLWSVCLTLYTHPIHTQSLTCTFTHKQTRCPFEPGPRQWFRSTQCPHRARNGAHSLWKTALVNSCFHIEEMERKELDKEAEIGRRGVEDNEEEYQLKRVWYLSCLSSTVTELLCWALTVNAAKYILYVCTFCVCEYFF